ncbi:hypothetical protein GLOTRDRAFT_129451 [Gloeophyllum trabeum ATCC 11539]|uniref:Fungal-type protein kinase domain-containing protein n=1 Tax=Gloeophyllum trabeum (strain ATCC 11539 / FP-39264 / Madison 617) TaxID=670483 RepID=S7Q6V3_GLOTA|nr:uncharacterized protein GLOTRDRAFT_129451 [Gloeophyllum trabeum ATCC 11539]EPQ55158.1 hypothetical protein GLOTRDRAFT_129451 [Gloeophyllum trabeum ATCC 11539]
MSSHTVGSSPGKHSLTGSRQHSAAVPDAKTKRKNHVYDMSGKFAGPMPADTFLKTFLPLPRSTLKTRKAATRECSEKILPPEYKWVNTATTMDEKEGGKRRSQLVDMGLYHSDHVPYSEQNGSPPKPRWDRVMLCAEFKSHANTNTMDPFEDDPTKWSEAVSQPRQDMRGQIVGYAAQMLAQQHRTHVFTLIVLGAWARFIRWDHSGAVFLERIRYAQCSQQISEFLWRFVKSSRQQQGYDETIKEIVKDSTEYNLLLAARDANEEQ